MEKSKAPVTPIGDVMRADEKWKQQVRLACVQAVSARVVSAQAAYDTQAIIRVADALTDFVFNGVRSD